MELLILSSRARPDPLVTVTDLTKATIEAMCDFRFVVFLCLYMFLCPFFSYVWSKCSLSSYVLLMLHMPTQAFSRSGRGSGSNADSVVPMLEILKNEELHWRSANKVLYSCISILYMYMCSSVFTWFLLICSFVLTHVLMFTCSSVFTWFLSYVLLLVNTGERFGFPGAHRT